MESFLNSFMGVKPTLSMMTFSSLVYDRRKRVAKTETALLPNNLVSLVEYLALIIMSPDMLHM